VTYYLADGGHVLITGATGARDDYGGKSVLANWWASELVEKGHRDVGLVVNPKGHSFYRGAHGGHLDDLAESYRQGERVLSLDVQAPDAAVAFVEELPGSAVVVFDEAWDYSQSQKLNEAVRQLGNVDGGGIRSLVVSQRAWDLPDAIRNSCPLKVWVGPLTSEGRRYFETMGQGGAADAIEGEMGAHEWAVVDGGELQDINQPVPERYAHG